MWTQTPTGCSGGCANNHVATATGAPSSSASGTGVNGGSRDPDGTQGFYDFGVQQYADIQSDSYTFAGWVKLGSITGDQTLFASWNPTTSAQQNWRVYYDDAVTDVFRFEVNTNTVATSISVAPSSPVATNTWYFVCAWIDSGGNTMNIVAEADGGTLPAPGSQALNHAVQNTSYGETIGFSGNPANDSVILSNGSALDMFGFWRTNLTSAQRSALFAKTPYGSFD